MGTLVSPTLPKTHRYCDCHPPQSHCQRQTYLRQLDREVSQVLHHPRHHPHSDSPLHKQDIWWSNGAQEMQTGKWDLELVLISNLPAQAELSHKGACLARFLNAVSGLRGPPAAPTKTRRAHAATIAKLTLAGGWQSQ